ncbi:hypothetical protein SMMN14_07242 [Sphaerulina musiva]
MWILLKISIRAHSASRSHQSRIPKALFPDTLFLAPEKVPSSVEVVWEVALD